MRRMIAHAERWLLKRYNFISNACYYYFQRGHRFRQSLEMARDTLP